MSAAYDFAPFEDADGAAGRPVPDLPRIGIDVFAETADVTEAVERARADRRLARTRMTVRDGGIARAREIYRNVVTPDLIIVESTAPAEQLLRNLAELADACVETTKVIVIGRANDIELYRALIDFGVSEYLLAPVEPLRLIAAMARLYSGPDASPLGRVIAFVGAKGGCGSSTIAHNAAWTIGERFAQRVLLIDLDLPFGTAGLNFQHEEARGLGDALDDIDSLDELKLERLLASHNDNLTLLNAPAQLAQTYDQAETSFDRVLELARASAPVVVVDLPHAWSAWIKHLVLGADEVVVTAEPDLANFRNLKNLLDAIGRARLNDRPPHLVLNKISVPKRPEISAKDIGSHLEITPLAEICFEPKLFGDAANAGKMIGETDAREKQLKPFETIAGAALRRQPPDPPAGGLLSGLFKPKGRAQPAPAAAGRRNRKGAR